jgi:tetratricopeptide (TPR) repeat protein
MSKKKLIIGLLIITSSLLVVNLNYKRYKSFEVQKILNEDHVLQKPLDRRGINFINSIDHNYPSLNVFAMPLASMKANYLLAKDSLERAIEYLELGSKVNPYLMFSESRLGELYLSMGDYKKSEYYIRKAFRELPNNPVHFILLTRILKQEQKLDSIYYNYNKIKDKIGPKDYQVYTIVLAALMDNQENFEKYDLNAIADEAMKIHGFEAVVQKMRDYVYYTQENVDSASELYDEAMSLLRKNELSDGIKILEEVIRLHPNVQIYYDNYIIANYRLGLNKPIVEIYNQYFESFSDISNNILYYMADSLYQENEVLSSCEILKILQTNRSFVIDVSNFPDCNN